MKQLYKCRPSILLWCLIFPAILMGQSHTPRTVTINAHCGGFYEYLPQNYAAGSQFPLLIYLHGQGDQGSGSTTDLALLLEDGPTKHINNGTFPASFNVRGRQYSFIVISPQFNAWPSVADVEAVIEYAEANYKVDHQRIYITGTSMGGGVTWEYAGSNSNYARKVAAIVPVCGASSPNSTAAETMAQEDLPVWATHNNGDNVVPVSYTNEYISYINNSSNPPTPLAKKTIFSATGHDAWTTTYDPGFKENGLNIYEWLLQYERVVQAPLPVTLSSYTVSATGNRSVVINWTTTAEKDNAWFSIEHSADGRQFKSIARVEADNLPAGSTYSFTDKNPVTGNNYYRLSQTDLDGKTTFFEVKKVVADAGENRLLLFPNPAAQVITLGLNHSATGRLTVGIMDAQGKIVQTTFYHKTSAYWQQQLSVAALPAGIYMVKVKGDGFEYLHRLVKK